MNHHVKEEKMNMNRVNIYPIQCIKRQVSGINYIDMLDMDPDVNVSDQKNLKFMSSEMLDCPSKSMKPSKNF